MECNEEILINSIRSNHEFLIKIAFFGCTSSVWQFPGISGNQLPKTASLIYTFDLRVGYFQTNHVVRLGAKSDLNYFNMWFTYVKHRWKHVANPKNYKQILVRSWVKENRTVNLWWLLVGCLALFALIVSQMSPRGRLMPVVPTGTSPNPTVHVVHRFSCPSSRRGSHGWGGCWWVFRGALGKVSTKPNNPPKSTCDHSRVERIET